MSGGFTDEQLGCLKAPLAREHVKSRQQAGRGISYIEGWHVIAEANRIFGFDAWDRETIECRCVSERQVKMGQNRDRDGWRVAYVGRVRITVRVGERAIVREGTGYGSGIDADVGEAHESAVKECETDCMKRAFMTFGNPFGLALYDKAQAQVEPETRQQSPPKPVQPRAAATPSSPANNGNGHQATAAASGERVMDHPQRDKALRAYSRIKGAIEAAATPKIVDDILMVNMADIDLIGEVHPPSRDLLKKIADARKGEVLAGA